MSDQNPVFIPGPTNMPERLRSAMNVVTKDHRSPDFAPWLAALLDDLKQIFKTESGTIVTFPSSGTGGWEAAITNTLSPGDKILIARYGMFSQKWIDMCQRHGLDVDVVDCQWGSGVPVDIFADRLNADNDHQIKAVLVTHNETATGVLSDVAGVRRAMDTARHPAMLYVDCVSSLASMDFRMDEWGVDLAISGSQKGFMMAAGLAVVAISNKAIAALDTAKCTRFYFDIRGMINTNAAGGYPYTPQLQLLAGLRAAVDMLLEEGLDNVFARHHRIAEGVRRAVAAWGLELCAQSPDLYSDSVSAIYVPDGFNADDLISHAYSAYGVSFGGGLGKMAGKVFRIGHLGMLSDVLALSGLATIEMAMKDLGYPITLGSGVAAAQEYYRKTVRAQKKAGDQ